MTANSRITRRGLLQTLGSATLAAGCKPSTAPPHHPTTSTSSTPGSAVPRDGEEIGPGPAPLRFVLNGSPIEVSANASTTLLALLRDQIGTTGPKEGCDRGACGACTVLVDGAPRNACMMLAHDVGNAEVTTVEGLADANGLSAVQRQFIAHDALQCGFCTSGMLVSCSALLRRAAASPGPKLTADDVNAAIAGNLCRCGSYPHIVQAVLAAASEKGLA